MQEIFIMQIKTIHYAATVIYCLTVIEAAINYSCGVKSTIFASKIYYYSTNTSL